MLQIDVAGSLWRNNKWVYVAGMIVIARPSGVCLEGRELGEDRVILLTSFLNPIPKLKEDHYV